MKKFCLCAMGKTVKQKPILRKLFIALYVIIEHN